MTWWQALILGIVEGVTEYLPVSSTGHLVLAARAVGLGKSEAVDAYTVCIQGGAILAVLGLYFGHVRQMAAGVLGQNPSGRRLALNVALAFLPIGVLGALFGETIKVYLLGLWPVVFAWFVGGAVILAFAWYPPRGVRHHLQLGHLTWKMALIIGLVQCAGLWPGTSRSLVTIAGGLLVGLSLAAAIEFSFLLGVVTLLAATARDALEHHEVMLHDLGAVNMTIGIVAAAISAAAAVKWMVSYLNKHGMAIFGYYRVGLAVVVAALIVAGVLEAEDPGTVEVTPTAAVATPRPS